MQVMETVWSVILRIMPAKLPWWPWSQKVAGDLAAYCMRFCSGGWTLTPLNAALIRWALHIPQLPALSFPSYYMNQITGTSAGFLWNNRSYCNQILPSWKNFMQLARTLHSQATEKSFFVLRLNTWNMLSRGPCPGPQWRGRSQDPITSLPVEGQPPQIFLPAPFGLASSDLAVGYSQMAEGVPLHGRTTSWGPPYSEATSTRGGSAEDSEMGDLEPTPLPPAHSHPPEAFARWECWQCLRESRQALGMGSISVPTRRWLPLETNKTPCFHLCFKTFTFQKKILCCFF